MLGPAAIVIAALVGAWFAARYASRNVSKELAAADRRLTAQLRHDRIMRQRDATRETIDEVVTTMTRMTDVLGDLIAHIGTAEQISARLEALPAESPERDALEEGCSELEDKIRPLLNSAREQSAAMFPARLRLGLRFPDDHPVLTSFSAWRSKILKLLDLAGKGTARTPAEREEALRLRSSVGTSLRKFSDDVRDWITDEDVSL